MMNLEPIPPIPAMNTAAVQFLDLLADPKAARKLMDDLIAAHAKASSSHAEATKLRSDVIIKESALDKAQRDFEQHRIAHSAFLKQSGEELDKRHNSVHERELRLAEAGADHDDREAKIAALEAALHVRENQVVTREQELAASKKEHAARVDHINLAMDHINRAMEHIHQGIAILSE